MWVPGGWPQFPPHGHCRGSAGGRGRVHEESTEGSQARGLVPEEGHCSAKAQSGRGSPESHWGKYCAPHLGRPGAPEGSNVRHLYAIALHSQTLVRHFRHSAPLYTPRWLTSAEKRAEMVDLCRKRAYANLRQFTPLYATLAKKLSIPGEKLYATLRHSYATSPRSYATLRHFAEVFDQSARHFTPLYATLRNLFPLFLQHFIVRHFTPLYATLPQCTPVYATLRRFTPRTNH